MPPNNLGGKDYQENILSKAPGQPIRNGSRIRRFGLKPSPAPCRNYRTDDNGNTTIQCRGDYADGPVVLPDMGPELLAENLEPLVAVYRGPQDELGEEAAAAGDSRAFGDGVCDYVRPGDVSADDHHRICNRDRFGPGGNPNAYTEDRPNL